MESECMHWYTVLILSACYAFDVRHDAIRGAVRCPADDARYTAIEPPLDSGLHQVCHNGGHDA